MHSHIENVIIELQYVGIHFGPKNLSDLSTIMWHKNYAILFSKTSFFCSECLAVFIINAECRMNVNRLITTLRVVCALDSRHANCPAAIRSQDTFLRVLRGIVLCIFVNVTSTEGKVCWLLL